jgi:hypothetical protein
MICPISKQLCPSLISQLPKFPMFSISYITTDKRQTFFVVFIVAFIANIGKEKSGVIPN